MSKYYFKKTENQQIYFEGDTLFSIKGKESTEETFTKEASSTIKAVIRLVNKLDNGK